MIYNKLQRDSNKILTNSKATNQVFMPFFGLVGAVNLMTNYNKVSHKKPKPLIIAYWLFEKSGFIGRTRTDSDGFGRNRTSQAKSLREIWERFGRDYFYRLLLLLSLVFSKIIIRFVKSFY